MRLLSLQTTTAQIEASQMCPQNMCWELQLPRKEVIEGVVEQEPLNAGNNFQWWQMSGVEGK